MVGLDTANLVGLFSGSILYGIYVVFYFASLYVLFGKRAASQPSLVLLVTSTLLFILITVITGINFSRILDAFVVHAADPGGALLYLEMAFDWKVLTLQVLGPLAMIFADSILIYRCWVVWSRNWWFISFPFTMLLGSIATFIFIVVQLTRTALYTAAVATSLNQGLQAFILLTLAQNLIVTGLIVVRLWRINAASAPYRNLQSLLMPVIWAVVESGGLYSAALVVFITVTFTDVFVESIMSAILNSLIGITFSLIIVRVGFHTKKTAATSAYEPSQPTSHAMQHISIRVNHQHADDEELGTLPPVRVTTSMSDFTRRDRQFGAKQESEDDADSRA